MASDFSKAFIQKKEVIREEVYGTIVIKNGIKMVQIDGSSIETPYIETVETNDNDRVSLSIKNHKVTVIGKIINEG